MSDWHTLRPQVSRFAYHKARLDKLLSIGENLWSSTATQFVQGARPENRDDRMLLLVYAYFQTNGLKNRPKYDSLTHHQIVARAYHLAGQRDKAIQESQLAIDEQQARLEKQRETGQDTDYHQSRLDGLSEILKTCKNK